MSETTKLLRDFCDWRDRAQGDDCEYINGSGWDDLDRIAERGRAALAALPVHQTGISAAREAFLNMIADAYVWEEQPDGDVNEHGRAIDCTTFKLITGWRQVEELCDALGIERRRTEETLAEAIDRHIQAPPSGAPS